MSTRTRGRPRQLMPEAGKRLVHPSHPESAAADLEQIPQPSQCTRCRSLCSHVDDEGWPCQNQCVIKKNHAFDHHCQEHLPPAVDTKAHPAGQPFDEDAQCSDYCHLCGPGSRCVKMYPHKGYHLCARCQGVKTEPKTSLLRQILNEKTEDAAPVTVKKEVCEPLSCFGPSLSLAFPKRSASIALSSG